MRPSGTLDPPNGLQFSFSPNYPPFAPGGKGGGAVVKEELGNGGTNRFASKR